MAIDIKTTETIRINKNVITVKVVVATGKEGDFFVALSPSVNVSGYGKTKKEAQDSFNENMITFCEDILRLPQHEREKELINLGFHKERFKNKNFSKAYVDENGVLKNFEKGTLEKKVLETSATA